MAEVILTDEAADWYDGLDLSDQDAATKAIERLVLNGVTLGFPHSSDVKGSKYALRELRVGGRPLRMFYIFDATREAIVLCGGDKSGGNQGRWYDVQIAKAEKIWEQYEKEQGR